MIGSRFCGTVANLSGGDKRFPVPVPPHGGEPGTVRSGTVPGTVGNRWELFDRARNNGVHKSIERLVSPSEHQKPEYGKDGRRDASTLPHRARISPLTGATDSCLVTSASTLSNQLLVISGSHGGHA
jgi:hypothetical protein